MFDMEYSVTSFHIESRSFFCTVHLEVFVSKTHLLLVFTWIGELMKECIKIRDNCNGHGFAENWDLIQLCHTLKTKNFGHLYFGHFNFGQNLSAISPKWLVLSWFFTWLKILSHMRSWFLIPFSYHWGLGLRYKPSKFRTNACPKFKLSEIFRFNVCITDNFL